MIHDAIELPWTLHDLSDVPEPERENVIRQRAVTEVRKPFQLATGPLVRACLLRLADDEYVFIWMMHHIVSDGWTLGVLLGELAELYTALTTGREARLPALPIQYADYAAWQRQYLAGKVLDEQLAYWKRQLAGAPEALELPDGPAAA